MDHRKTKVESIAKLNQYLASLGFKYQLAAINSDRVCFVGVDRLGDARAWPDNNIPRSLLQKITYADWVDLMLSLAGKGWGF